MKKIAALFVSIALVVSLAGCKGNTATDTTGAATLNELNPEEKEAATWMLNNIANSQYISFEDVQAGRVDLSECEIMWWRHFRSSAGHRTRHRRNDGGIDGERQKRWQNV